MRYAFSALLILTAATPRPQAPSPRGYYVSPSGSRAGDGSLRRPWDLATALAGGGGLRRIGAGDTIWVRGGTYRGAFRSMVRGSDGKPVVIRAYRGERAVLDGAGQRASTLAVLGDYTIVWGLELTNSSRVRTATVASHDARPDAVYNSASHTKYIHLIIHDGGVAWYTEAATVDVEIVGCIIYDNGWDGPDRGHGHGLYLKSLTGPLVAKDNVIFRQYGYGIHAYSNASSGRLVGLRIEGNIAFENGTRSSDRAAPNLLLGGPAYATNDVVRDNVTFLSPGLPGPNVRIGQGSTRNGSVEVLGNYFVGGSPVLAVGEWQAARIDSNTVVEDGGRHPRETNVFVRPSLYEPGRATIAVINWARQDTVRYALLGVLAPGDRYELRRVDDLFGKPLRVATFRGDSLEIPLTTNSRFEVFLLRKI